MRKTLTILGTALLMTSAVHAQQCQINNGDMESIETVNLVDPLCTASITRPTDWFSQYELWYGFESYVCGTEIGNPLTAEKSSNAYSGNNALKVFNGVNRTGAFTGDAFNVLSCTPAERPQTIEGFYNTNNNGGNLSANLRIYLLGGNPTANEIDDFIRCRSLGGCTLSSQYQLYSFRAPAGQTYMPQTNGSWQSFSYDLTTIPQSILDQTQHIIIRLENGGKRNAYTLYDDIKLTYCTTPAEVPAPAAINAYKFYLADVIQWPAVSHPNLKGYNVYFDDGTTTSMKFSPTNQWINFANLSPGTYNYELRTVIEEMCDGVLTEIESATGPSSTITYSAVEDQCVLFGAYKSDFQYIGNAWYMNLYTWDGSNWQLWIGPVPMTIDYLFWCAQYGSPIPGAKSVQETITEEEMLEIISGNMCIEYPENCTGGEANMENMIAAIDDNDLRQTHLQIHPNPIDNGVLNFDLNLKVGEKLEYVIIQDMLGKTIIQANASSINNGQINLSPSIPSGIYYLQAITNKHRYQEKITLKQ